MTMVASDYAAIITARDVEFLEGDVVAAVVVQPLRLVGRDNSCPRWVALYTMEKQAIGSWRISGCLDGAVDGADDLERSNESARACARGLARCYVAVDFQRSHTSSKAVSKLRV